jgi:hypothetical protein
MLLDSNRLYWGRLQDRSSAAARWGIDDAWFRRFPSIRTYRGVAGGQSRFGRGRGNGTARRTTSVFGKGVVS